MSVREALRAMMGVSSNSAGHALLRRLGREQFNAGMAGLGLPNTRVPLDEDAAAVTTAADMARLLGFIVRDEGLGEASRAELHRLMALSEPLDPLRDALPEGTPIFSKAGNLARASNVVGLVITPAGPVSISVLDEDVDPGDARAMIAELARAAYAFGAP